MNEREAAIASFHHHGTGVEVKGFDKLYDVVISHDDIVPDRRVVVLRLASSRADSKCRGLIAKSITDNSPRLDSTVAMTYHRSSPSSAAAPILPPIVISLMAPFRSFFTAPVWEHVLVLRRPTFWRNAENDLDVVLIDFDPALHGANNLPPAVAIETVESLHDLGGEILGAADDKRKIAFETGCIFSSLMPLFE